MAGARNVFTHTEPELLPVLEELRRREPIFHTVEFGTTPAELEAGTSPDFWEVGASGRRYSRAFITNELYKNGSPLADDLGWTTAEHAVRRLGENIYLFTYSLQQSDRLTRRATIWERVGDGWRVTYHQGTAVTAAGDDVVS